MKGMGKVDWIAWLLVVLGALNWGFVGVANLNLITSLFGSSAVTQVLYILVGLGGLYMVWMAVSKK